MIIRFFKGNDHQTEFKFPKFNGEISEIYFTVKCMTGTKRIQKKLNHGITLENGYYVITFVPDDTKDISCDLDMKYDIKIITGGKKYTVIKDKFILDDVVTDIEDEV